MFKPGLCLPTALLAAAMTTAAAQELPRLQTNEAYVNEVTTRTQKLAIDDPMAVFAYVLGSLPDRVKVYPTENHYYFSFDLNGTRYAGNIKIDALPARARQGRILLLRRSRELAARTARRPRLTLDASRGVTVEKIDPLAYRLTYRNKSVIFALNDLSQVKPPAAALAPDDQFIGPVFDEFGGAVLPGVQQPSSNYFTTFSTKRSQPADVFVPAPVGNGRILIGKRTGFAVYRDQHRDRKILIGVFHDNVVANNYLDGPFDQMPDNFIEGDTFRQAILAVAPDLKGQINRYGSFADGARFADRALHGIPQPEGAGDLRSLRHQPAHSGARYDACFALPLEGRHDANARPLAMLRHPRLR